MQLREGKGILQQYIQSNNDVWWYKLQDIMIGQFPSIKMSDIIVTDES